MLISFALHRSLSQCTAQVLALTSWCFAWPVLDLAFCPCLPLVAGATKPEWEQRLVSIWTYATSASHHGIDCSWMLMHLPTCGQRYAFFYCNVCWCFRNQCSEWRNKYSQRVLQTGESSNLVDSASSHTLVSKTKPCTSKYKYFTLKLRMAHYISYSLFDSPLLFG